MNNCDNSGEIMKTIEIEDDLYKYILNNIEAFGETPSQILRRLLIVAAENNTPQETPAESKTPLKAVKETLTPAAHVEKEDKPKVVAPAVQTEIKQSSAEHFCEGVKQLFEDPIFKSESVVTNKFMMMLTTMYLEKTEEFVEAADKTRGRTRAYLGTHLQDLLNSDNEEELTQFKASKPRAIPQTPFWVITNANTGRKRIILTQMMASMGYPHSLIERIKEEI